MKKIFILITIMLIFPVVTNAEIRLRDNFEYAVDRNTPNASATFATSGGWNGAKTVQDGQPGARGYIYTVTSIPGFTGSFPGNNSSRVLCVEALPATLGGQTDLYLSFGGPGAAQDTIPANVWIQFWVYFQRYGSQLSFFNDGKWLYPSRDGNYPSTGLDWLLLFKQNSYSPYFRTTTQANVYPELEGITGPANYSPQYPDNHWKLGYNTSSNVGPIPQNTWTLVKIHIDTSGVSPLAPAGQGVWQMWTKPVGGGFTNVANWIGGVTPNFTWPIRSSGHKAIRWPTTINTNDSWMYYDDFVIATSEADLPQYQGGNPITSITPPSNLRIQ